MTDTNREALGRVLLPVLEKLAEAASLQMSHADEDALASALEAARIYFAPATRDNL